MQNILLLVWLHFVGDFILQTDKMALNKSKEMDWLLLHCAVYAVPFLYFGLPFALVNFALHFFTDMVTSRVTSTLWKMEKRHCFFVVIGLDQAIHLSCLLLTYNLFLTGKTLLM